MTYIRPAHLWRITTKPAELERERSAALKRINRERARLGLEPLTVGPLESIQTVSRKVQCSTCPKEFRTTARLGYQRQHRCGDCRSREHRRAA